jgi:histidinol-phosphatase (PHP family)
VTPIDLHVHSTYSVDGVSSIGELARLAADLGLHEVGFCEHADFDPRDIGHNHLDLVSYDQAIATARSTVPRLRLRQGVEITYQSSREQEIQTWLAGHTWDYVVAAVHLVDYEDGWAIVSEPGAMAAYFQTHEQRQAYTPYFEELYRAAKSGLGDLLGHLDLIKRYGVRHYGAFEPTCFEDEIRAVLSTAIDEGTGLEINTSGLRQAPGEPYPGLRILRWYRELGGEILTVGSDAHGIKDLGSGVREAVALAQQAGFRAMATFEQRRIQWIDLDVLVRATGLRQ